MNHIKLEVNFIKAEYSTVRDEFRSHNAACVINNRLIKIV